MSHVSTEQLRQLSLMLQPVIARYLGAPVHDTAVSITCTPINGDDPDGASIMRFDVRVRDEAISSEQETMISHLLQTAGGSNGAIVKAKGDPV